jgi:putative membrane protein
MTKGPTPGMADPGAWQRLSPWALVFLVARRVQRLIRENLYFFLGAGAGSVFLEWLGPRELLFGFVAIVLATVAGAIVHHRRFRFRLEADAVRVRSGLVERKELRIPFARVMNVDLSQPLYLRPFRLVKLSLETPGARATEVELPGISRPLAETMRERIAAARADAATTKTLDQEADETEAVAPGVVLFQASRRDLLLHGLVSNQVWILAGAFLSLVGLLERRLWRLVDEERLGQMLARVGEELGGTLLVATSALALLLVVSMLIAWVRFYGFTLWRIDDRFRTRCGVLEIRERTVPRVKLLGVMVAQTAFGRLLGRWYLVGRQAGVVSPQEQERPGNFMVPGLGQQGLRRLLGSLGDGVQEVPALNPIDASYRRVLATRWVVALVGLAGVTWAPGFEAEWGAGGFLALLPLAVAGVHLRWRHWGWAERSGLLWVRRGLLGHRVEVFPMAGAQRVEVRQSPVQRRRGVADLVLTLPYGPVVIPFLPRSTACALADRVLWQVETAPTHRL